MIPVRDKLKLLQQRGIGDVVGEILALYREDISGYSPLAEEEYRELAVEIVKALSHGYREEMKQMEVKSTQVDLEDSIAEMKKLESNWKGGTKEEYETHNK